jgi:hypothetical protein
LTSNTAALRFIAFPSTARAAPPGTTASFTVLSSDPERAAPFAAIDLVYGASERANGQTQQWWQLEALASDDAKVPPLFTLRLLTNRDPLAVSDTPLIFLRYQLRTPGGQTVEYHDVRTGAALLPPWKDFTRHFIPQPAPTAARQHGIPGTATYLGHTLALRQVTQNEAWQPWDDVNLLKLDRELLVGTGRNFRDAELKRLPQPPPPRSGRTTPTSDSRAKSTTR